MKPITPFAIPLIGALLVTGCASTEAFRQGMDSRIGTPIATIQQQFGYNFIERHVNPDTRAFTWVWAQSGETPGYEAPTTIRTIESGTTVTTSVTPGTYFPPRRYTISCEFSFLVGTDDRVKAWRAHGDGCGAMDVEGHYLSSGQLPAGQ